ncbi:MAG: beta/gamma crystallin-related protein [Sphingomonadaceae bacterium]
MPVGPIPRGGANVDFGKMGNLNVGYGSAAAPDRDDDDDWDSDFGGSQPPASKRGDGLILYRDVNFQGPSITIRFDEPDLAWRQFADAASSARVIAGTWELCENARFGGHCIKLKRDMPIFITVPDFNDVASSARRIDVPGEQRPGLALYEDTQFGGRSILIEQNTPDLGVVEFGKLASSLEVVGGAWLVCQEPHYRGRCQKITRDASDLIAVDWNDTIASVRRIR